MTLVVALFAIAGITWLIPVIQRGHLVLVAGLILIVGTITGPQFFSVEGPIQISLDRALWFAILAMIPLAWRLGQLRRITLTRADWLVIGLVGWTLLSLLMTSSAREPVVPPRSRWLFYIVMPAGMYAFARFMNVRRIDVQWLIGGMVGLGCYLSVTAVLEVSGMHGLVFPRYIVDETSWQFFGRGRGPLMNPTANGFLISIALAAAALKLVHSGRRGKLVYSIALIVMLAGLYSTFTRSTWLGGAAALGIVAFFFVPRWVRILGLASVVLLVGTSALGVKDQFVRMKRDKMLTAADAEKSMQLRPLLAVVAWEMFKDRPVVGHGFGHYDVKKDPYHNNRTYGLPLQEARRYTQHNIFLSIVVETGLIGLVILLSLILVVASAAWALARNGQGSIESRTIGMFVLALLAAYLCNGMFHHVLIIPMTQMFVMFVSGLAISIHQQGFVTDPHPSRVAHRSSDRAAAVA